MSSVAIVILAAGDGKRMKTGIPKVLNLLKGKPLVAHVVESVRATGLVKKPVVVVSASHTLVQDALRDEAVYVIQERQLGTGHAVGVTEDILKDKAGSVVVLYGDMPFIKPESITRLVDEHQSKRNVVTLMTVTVSDFAEWRSQFDDFGRIVRSAEGSIIKIIEKRDAIEAERALHEVNPAFFCFDAPWLWAHVKALRNSNAQGEYYLTDLVQLAIKEGSPISSIPVDPREAVGINTKEHLAAAESL